MSDLHLYLNEVMTVEEFANVTQVPTKPPPPPQLSDPALRKLRSWNLQPTMPFMADNQSCPDLTSSTILNRSSGALEASLDAGLQTLADSVLVVICATSFLLGVSGSLFVLLRIVLRPRLMSFRYFLVANQAVFDFSNTFFLAGSRVLQQYDIISSLLRCRSLAVLYAGCEFVSPNILLLLCVERFVLCIYPLQKHKYLTNRNYLASVGALWATCIVISSGFIIASHVCSFGDSDKTYYCHLKFYSFPPAATSLMLLLLCYAIPFFAQLVLYTIIAVKAVRDMKQVDELTNGHRSAFNDGNRKVYRLAKIFLLVSVNVAMLRLPKNIVQVIFIKDEFFELNPDPYNKGAAYFLLWYWGVMLTYLSSALTPWVYIVMSPYMSAPLRKAVTRARRFLTRCRPRSPGGTLRSHNTDISLVPPAPGETNNNNNLPVIRVSPITSALDSTM